MNVAIVNCVSCRSCASHLPAGSAHRLYASDGDLRVHVPRLARQDRVRQQELEQVVGIPVPTIQADMVQEVAQEAPALQI